MVLMRSRAAAVAAAGGRRAGRGGVQGARVLAWGVPLVPRVCVIGESSAVVLWCAATACVTTNSKLLVRQPAGCV
jgi:hypothetical protein